jgi:hypothetical protein
MHEEVFHSSWFTYSREAVSYIRVPRCVFRATGRGVVIVMGRCPSGPAYNVSKDAGHREFNLRGMLLWTIYNYPGYSAVGGFAHQGYARCPYCGSSLGAEHFVELGKQTYGGTRRWLDPNHAYRRVGMKDHFNKLVEDHDRPNIVSVEEQFQHAADRVVCGAGRPPRPPAHPIRPIDQGCLIGRVRG